MTEFKQIIGRGTRIDEDHGKRFFTIMDKLENEGAFFDDLEIMEILKVKPLSSFGTPVEIVNLFGTKQDYLRALKDLEAELYSEVS